MPSDTVIAALIAAVIGALVSPLVLLFMNKYFSKPFDQNTMISQTQKIAEQAVDDLAVESERRAALERRVFELEKAQRAPIKLEAVIIQNQDGPRVARADASYMIEESNKPT